MHAAGTDFDRRLGHALATRAEQAKIDIGGLAGDAGAVAIALDAIEAGLASTRSPGQAASAIEADAARNEAAARETFAPGRCGRCCCERALPHRQLHRLRAAGAAPRGDRFASVAQGLGLHAARLFGR